MPANRSNFPAASAASPGWSSASARRARRAPRRPGDEDAGVQNAPCAISSSARRGAGFSTKRATRRGAVRVGIIGAGGGAGGSSGGAPAAGGRQCLGQLEDRVRGRVERDVDSDATRGSPSTADDTSASSEPDDVVSSSAASGASAGA
jgi:hypothetical protein